MRGAQRKKPLGAERAIQAGLPLEGSAKINKRRVVLKHLKFERGAPHKKPPLGAERALQAGSLFEGSAKTRGGVVF